MKNKFKTYLINQGYKQTTPSGRPSTVYDYIKRIDSVCIQENESWASLAQKIDSIVQEYDKGGCKEYLGQKSHRAVINSLKRYAEFTALNQKENVYV